MGKIVGLGAKKPKNEKNELKEIKKELAIVKKANEELTNQVATLTAENEELKKLQKKDNE